MRDVVLTKSVRLAAGRPMSLAGQTVSVDDATFERLKQLGAIIIDTPVIQVDDHVQVDENPAQEPEVDDQPKPASKQIPLPEKTAPASEWKEYARLNGISLTGLTKKNEIIGFVTKAMNAKK